MKHLYNKITRRALLAGTISSLIPIRSLSQFNRHSLDTAKFDWITRQRIALNLVNAAFNDPLETKQLGFVYLDIFPQEAKLNYLINTILMNNYTLANYAEKGEIIKLSEILTAQIKNDFLFNNVINIDNWIVSKTEARLSALDTFI